MKLLKWLFGSRKPTFNKPVVSGSLLSFEQCLREEFLMNTQNYPKECHNLFCQKFERAEKRFREQSNNDRIMIKEETYLEALEIRGNNGGNYVKVSKIADEDNRIFLEIGDCCVVTFRGVLTAEMLSNFLTNVSLNANKPLIEVIKENMSWDKDTNERFCIGAKAMSWHDTI